MESIWGIFRYYGDWVNSVERKGVNSNGEVTSGSELAGYEYTITFDRHRGDDVGVMPEFLIEQTEGNVKFDS